MCAFRCRKLDRTMTGRRVALTITAGSELHKDSHIRAYKSHYRFLNIISLAAKITMFNIIHVLSRSM